MQEWSSVRDLVSDQLSQFLSEALPEVGGQDWWQNCVLEQLTPGQLQAISALDAEDLHGFDLTTLIRVAERNWTEIVYKKSIKRDGKRLLDELKAICHKHDQTLPGCVDLDDQIRDVDTVQRFMSAIGSDPAALKQVKAIHRHLLMKSMRDDEDDEDHDHDETASAVMSAPSGPKDGGWIIDTTAHRGEVQKAIAAKTYVGIDFGTSTSVVSVILKESDRQMAARTLTIDQPEKYGGHISDHLVNTVLAWYQNQLFFGRDAYEMRQRLFEGKNVFSSFKMKLGINVGPTYPETALPRGKESVTIEDANDATQEFFRLLAGGIKKAIADANLPPELCFAVTVPASFEANQRRDLLHNMKEAGLPVSESCLIDEPNAAFLSFLHETARDATDHALLEQLKTGALNILVYDFGAGTCDVSILQIGVEKGRISSKNRAISRFTALGGDDFDRAIARDVLLPQLLASCPGFDPELRDIEERLIPRLQPTAERLKIAAMKWIVDHNLFTLTDVRSEKEMSFQDHAIPSFSIRGKQLSLSKPVLTLGKLAEAMNPFVRQYNPNISTAHVFAPVADAIDKSGLQADELNAVLFIGGSAANPVVRHAVMTHLPKSVKSIVPRDLRTHVSLGAALHSLGYHAFGFDLIKPITSEPIFVITKGGRRETIIPASSEVPSRNVFNTKLRVNKRNQRVVELPICVSSEGKLLGLLKLRSKGKNAFQLGEEVFISARITHEKLLEVEARVAGVVVEASLLNPLANQDLTLAETRMLEAKQKFNEELLNTKGRLPVDVVLAYAKAALNAEAYEVAADMFVAAERIDGTQDHATNICYAYSRAGRYEKSKEWGKRAYERDPCALTAYNMSCKCSGDDKEHYLRESLSFDSNYCLALWQLGKILRAQNDPEGKEMIQKAVSLLTRELHHHTISKNECKTLIEAAELLDQDDILQQAKARLDSFAESKAYDEDNLASSIDGERFLTRN